MSADAAAFVNGDYDTFGLLNLEAANEGDDDVCTYIYIYT